MVEEVMVDCPCCGESFESLVDGSAALEGDLQADYIEDCAVCCQPIRFLVTFSEAGALESISLQRDAD